MSDSLTRVELANGLIVLLKEIHTSPIISQWIWYRIGSRDEIPGITGISHWVEHMQFKGTPTFPAGILDKSISREGGFWNAMTFFDWTTYFEVMPADKIDLALRLEADRMVNSTFDEEVVASERTVIISERQGSENEPLFLLGEALKASAFRVHPYHHEIIGDLADLQTIQRQDLYNHYRSYYSPNNAVLAISGDFNTDAMLSRLRRLFEPIPPGAVPQRHMRPEPSQSGEIRLTVEGSGETTYLQIAYHVPEASHPDFFPLTVLDSLLTGPSSLNMFGGGISNKTSRLYRSLVEKELAISIQGGLQATIDPFLYGITVVLHPQHTVEELLEVIDREINILQQAPPPVVDLHRAVKQARALFAYGSESTTNQAFWMGFSEMFSTYTWFERYLDNLSLVTPEDIQRVAQKYFMNKNRIVGVYSPTGTQPDIN